MFSNMEHENYIDWVCLKFNLKKKKLNKHSIILIKRSSSGFGENSKPIVGFSFLQPQNDPKKCIYLMVGHSSLINVPQKTDKSKRDDQSPKDNKTLNRKSFVSNHENLGSSFNKSKVLNETALEATVEIDNDDDDENDSSFILIYQIMFERCVNIFLNQNENYMLYEVNLFEWTFIESPLTSIVYF